jgi:hypothetical protein
MALDRVGTARTEVREKSQKSDASFEQNGAFQDENGTVFVEIGVF